MTKEDVKGSSIREKKAGKKEERERRGCLSGHTAAFPSRLTHSLGLLTISKKISAKGGREGGTAHHNGPSSVASISDDTHWTSKQTYQHPAGKFEESSPSLQKLSYE